jgi:ATP-dependent DNA helicase RecQ
MTRDQAETKLQTTFKLPRFYNTQWEVIEKVFNGERILLIEKTGFGKSLCYQFPAIQFSGTTVIFSPLIALMRDQVNKLQALGINAKCINSNQTPEENEQIIEEARNNKIKILYIAPERMENVEWLEATRTMNLSMVVIDEAHCISVWGHDFRPAFKRIISLVNLLPKNFPVLATTATATKRVEEDIKNQIGKNISSYRGNLVRDNLSLWVVHVESEDEKMIWLGKNLPKIVGSGIIYTGTKANTEIYSKWFEYLKINSTFYNGGLDAETRQRVEEGLINNSYKCVVSTNALGMGIDKPDIRFIVHTQIPVSPIHYYQEIGRAGRDGKPSNIILFYNKKDDLALPQSFIDGGRPPIKKYQRVINALKRERLGRNGVIKKTNIKQTQVKVILSDLIEQEIINQVIEGKRKYYEYRFNAPELNTEPFETLRNAKQTDFAKMIEYVELRSCRMKFLCDFLGDDFSTSCKVCDNDRGKRLRITITEDWKKELTDFRESYFPTLKVESKRSNIVNGVAASYYGVSNVGQALHNSKYQSGGDFPDWLLRLTLKAFRKHYKKEKFDVILYIPPTESGDLVKNFAQKIAKVLNFPVSDGLKKTRVTDSQKIFQTGLLKIDNVKNAFYYLDVSEISGKSILLIDDIFDSGATIKEVGKYLTKLGAIKIAPLIIAKTVGSDVL